MASHQDIHTDAEYEAEEFRQARTVKSQLASWHANSGDKGFLRSCIPSWRTPVVGEEHVTKNPFKLLAMVSPFGWLMFLSVSAVSHPGIWAYPDQRAGMVGVDMRWVRLLRRVVDGRTTWRTIQGGH
jgi:hypothetical protein